MSDPISRLDQFRADTPGAPMKTAAEVRARGNQIRRRRTAVVAAVAAAAVVAVGSSVAALTGSLGDRGVDPAPAAPSQSSTPAPSPTGSASGSTPGSGLTSANLPTETDLVTPESYPRWVATTTDDSEGTGYNECLTTSLADAGARSSFRRDFVPDPEGDNASSAGTLDAVIGEFGSADAARTAQRTLSQEATSCSPHDAQIAGYLPVDGGAVDSGQVDVVTYASDDPAMNARVEVATAVAAAGDRVVVLTRERGVQDYVAPTDLQASAVKAAQRLVEGGGTSTGEATEASGSPSADPVLSDANLPAATSLPNLDRFPEKLGWTSYTPSPEVPTLACQKEWLNALEPAEKVTRDIRWDTDSAMVGQVHVAVLEFGDVNAAGAAYNRVMEWQEICPASKLGTRASVTAKPRDVGRDIKLGLDRAAQSSVTYPAGRGDAGDNDSTWFETELVAQYDQRLVLVGYGESAGPCPPSTGDKTDPCYQPDVPDTWPGRILEIEKAAVRAGVSDLR